MQFINAIEMILLKICYLYSSAYPRQISSVFITYNIHNGYTIFLSVVLEVNCFHIFVKEAVSVALQAVVPFKYVQFRFM